MNGVATCHGHSRGFCGATILHRAGGIGSTGGVGAGLSGILHAPTSEPRRRLCCPQTVRRQGTVRRKARTGPVHERGQKWQWEGVASGWMGSQALLSQSRSRSMCLAALVRGNTKQTGQAGR
jgi:hypothetical protein